MSEEGRAMLMCTEETKLPDLVRMAFPSLMKP
jgi:hypothetical protein